MSDPDDSLREQLLRQHVPNSEKLQTYRQETQAMLEREERWVRFYSRFYAAIWIMLVVMGMMFALVAGWAPDKPTKVYFTIGVTLFMLMLGGAVQLVGGFIGRARLEVTKDIKGLELRVLELEALLRGRLPSSTAGQASANQ
jgi:hypothetical protein